MFTLTPTQVQALASKCKLIVDSHRPGDGTIYYSFFLPGKEKGTYGKQILACKGRREATAFLTGFLEACNLYENPDLFCDSWYRELRER